MLQGVNILQQLTRHLMIYGSIRIHIIIKIQSIVRGNVIRSNNIYATFRKFRTLQLPFDKEVGGFHFFHTTAIKEMIWEGIKSNICRLIFNITDEANGNHASGIDIRLDNIGYSIKTAKASKPSKNNEYIVSISSYRLTSVTTDSDNGTSPQILKEIEKRDSSFKYYSLLVRIEEGVMIKYMWYIIPKDYYVFKIDTLTPKIGKQGKKKGKIIGWESDNCDITFSMSSQLWYKIKLADIEKYKVCATEIDNSKPKMTYAQAHELFTNHI